MPRDNCDIAILRLQIAQGHILLDGHMESVFLCICGCPRVLSNMLAWYNVFNNAEILCGHYGKGFTDNYLCLLL